MFYLAHISLLLIVILLVTVVRMRAKNQLRRYFIAYLLELFIWTASVLAQRYSVDLGFADRIIFFENLTYIGVSLIPVSMLLIGKSYFNASGTKAANPYVFYIVPAITQLVIWINPLHHLFYANYNYFDKSELALGWYFYIHTLYSYACLLTGMYYVFRFALQSRGNTYWQALLIGIGSLTPIIVNICYTLDIGGFSVFSTPIAFIVTILAYFWVIFRFNFLSVAPIAMRAAIDKASDLYIVVDTDMHIVDYNEPFFALFSPLARLKKGLSLTEALAEQNRTGLDPTRLCELIDGCRDSLTPTRKDFSLVVEGETRQYSVEFTPFLFEGAYYACIILLKDITQAQRDMMEIRRSREELEIAYNEAKEASIAKSSFLANMSHEIRTPMNAILGITEIQLQDESLSPATREAFDKIYNSGDMLLGIVNDILDLSKIEAGKFELVVDTYEVASLINDTAQINVLRIGSKPIRFELNVDEDTPSILFGDGLRVKQILNNLLSNAFKYTAEGLVRMSVSALPHSESAAETTLVLRVSDTGQGMTEEQVERLFDEYSRFNLQANRATEGAGLGMSITRNLIRLMNGKISVLSEPGQGTEFLVHLPQGLVGQGVLGRELAENLRQFRIGGRSQMKRAQITREPMPYGSVLVVDDVETNIYVARGLLTPYTLQIDDADSGRAVIEKVERGNVYDIIFMDHMMPEMDGIEATRIIRDMGYTGSIVALTANAVVGQSEMFLSHGFDDFISKPIDIRQLNIVLNRLVRDKQPPEVVEAARRQAAGDGVQPGGGTAQADSAITPSGSKTPQSPDNALPDNALPDNLLTDDLPTDDSLTVSPLLVELFVRDASKAIVTLEAILEKGGKLGDDDLRAYMISVHGMKSVLANYGDHDLSAVAARLEQAAREGEADIVRAGTPAFLSALRLLVEAGKPRRDTADDKTIDEENEDRVFLSENLDVLKAACVSFEKKAAKDALTRLQDKTWSGSTRELLDQVAEYLLHSEFDEIIRFIDTFFASIH